MTEKSKLDVMISRLKDPHEQLFVCRIPKSATRDEIIMEAKKLLDGVVDVTSYADPNNLAENRGYCFIKFENGKKAIEAKKKLRVKRFLGCPVVTDWARPLVRDEDAPRPPMNGYQRFAFANRERVQETNPDVTTHEVFRLLTEEWKAMSLEDKQPYWNEANQEAEVYKQKLEEYQSNCQASGDGKKDVEAKPKPKFVKRRNVRGRQSQVHNEEN